MAMLPREEREVMNAVFAGALTILAIFLGFVGVLAAVRPELERVSYLKQLLSVSSWASLIGVLLAASVSGASLAYLCGHRNVRPAWIITGMYALIVAILFATLSLVWAVGL